MKNPHGVEPTRFMKRKDSEYAIYCNPDDGPVFGFYSCYDISIHDNCNEEDSCLIINNGTNGYECHPKYKSSLFLNTEKPNKWSCFSVLDYEVYTHN